MMDEMSGIEDIRPASGSFEYHLNVPTVIKHSAAVFYMNQGEWYEFSIDTKESCSEKLYFQVRLDFVNQEYQKSRSELIGEWINRHPDCRILELEPPEKDSPGMVLYNEKPDNVAQYIINGSEKIKFKVKINCLESQFYKKIPVINAPMGFLLIVKTYAEESATLLDTTLCLVRTFWNGRSKFNYESDRFVLLDKNPNIACPSKYSLIQTIVNPVASPEEAGHEALESNKLESDSLPNSIVDKKSSRLFDERMFVCVLQAPHITQNGTYIEKDSLYGLVIKPINFDSSEFIQTKIFLDFGSSISASNISAALTNWSIISRQKFAFIINSNRSELDESVHDVYQNSCNEAYLIWSPDSTKEIKLMLMFNVESSKLARFVTVPEVDLSLIVQTSEMTSGKILDQSECKIRIFSPGTSSRQLQIDTADSSESQTTEDYTIMENSSSSKLRKQIELNQLSDETTSSEQDSVAEKTKKVGLKIASVNLDGQKLFTLQERFFLEHFTVAELELQVLDLIHRKQASQPVKSAALFLADVLMTDDIVSLIAFDESIDYDLSIITDDPSGDFLAYFNANN